MKAIICLFVLLYIRSVQAQTELSLRGKKATQSETWSDRVADLAIDGNATSFSVAASSSNPAALGWWEVDLGGIYRVAEVRITSSFDDYNARYLQNFTIQLLAEDRTSTTCYTYPSENSIPPNQTGSFQCSNQAPSTRFIRISRLGGNFRPDGLSLAEVQVFVSYNQTGPSSIISSQVNADTGNKTSINIPPVANGYEISLSGLKTYQTGTWGDHYSYLAIDNNNDTYSFACLFCDHTLNGEVGWWQIDFGYDRPIVGVKLVSSKDHYYSIYLHDVIVALTSINTTDLSSARICYDFSNSSTFPAGSTLAFNCVARPTWGRFLLVSRKATARFKPDVIAIAEFKAFEATPTVPPVPIIETSINIPPVANGYEISLNGLKTHQTGTWRDYYSFLAIDNNHDTFSIACFLCDNTLKGGVGWWQIDFGYDRPIVGVKLTSSKNQYNSNYLQDFIVALTSINTTDLSSARICYDFSNSSTIPAGSTLAFNCVARPTWGRFLLVSRKRTAKFRPDAIAIAEFKAFEATPTVPPVPIIADPGNKTSINIPPVANGYEISLSGLKTYQIGTWGDHYSYLAIDNNNDTYSFACPICDNTLNGEVGWWQIDFGYDRPIVGVKLISSKDHYNSIYLQDVIVALTSINTTDLSSARICYDFSNSSTFPAGSTLAFNCVARPTWGRFLLVSRKRTAMFRPDAIAIAEFKAFEATPTVPPVPITANPGRDVIIRKVRDFNSSVERLSAADVTIRYA